MSFQILYNLLLSIIIVAGDNSDLQKYLQRNANHMFMPPRINVSFNGNLMQLVNLNEVDQSFTVYVWLEYTWIDPRLAWTPEISNLNTTFLPRQSIWMPDVMCFNHIDSTDQFEHVAAQYVMVSSEGLVTFSFPMVYTIPCHIDVTLAIPKTASVEFTKVDKEIYAHHYWKFPFDTQVCNMKIGSWIFPLEFMDMYSKAPQLDLTNQSTNNLWDTVRVDIVYNLTVLECCPKGDYVVLNLYFYFKRKPQYYYMTLIMPTLMISFVSIVGTFFPSNSNGDRTEKTTLGVTTTLTMAVFLLMVADKLPRDSTTSPLIGIFIFFQITLNTATTITAALIMKYHMHAFDETAVPAWVNTVIHKLTNCHHRAKGTGVHDYSVCMTAAMLDRFFLYLYASLLILGSVLFNLVLPQVLAAAH